MHRLTIFLIFILFTTSCSLLDPVVYRIPVQQGNIIDQDQVDKLQIGMTKDQVEFVLGTPMVTDAFNASYWEYLYVLTTSNGSEITKNLVVTFEDDLLSEFAGNFIEEKQEDDEAEPKEPSDNEEPSANKESSASNEPSTNEEPV